MRTLKTGLTFLLLGSSDLAESLLVRLSRPGICKLLEDSLRIILLSWWPLSPLETWVVVVLTFSADLAALMTILSKLTEDKVLLVAWGVTNILRILRRSSSCACALFLGDSVIYTIGNISYRNCLGTYTEEQIWCKMCWHSLALT